MERTRITTRTAGFTLLAGMAAALVTGFTGQQAHASTGSPPLTDSPTGDSQGTGIIVSADKALAKAEARVAKSANSLSGRVELAQTYFAAGRFDSAATTFEDAIALGDQSPKTGLSLALSYIGIGRNEAAVDVLARYQDRLPASDLGLAVALAGKPAQGVALLTDTLRGGENTAKVRQNLAYAYALDGRWAESRVIAAQDVPADQINARMEEWASRALPEQGQLRVARLLGVPVSHDPGQPVALAMNGPVERAVRSEQVQMAAAVVPAAPADNAELPAVQSGESFWGATPSLASAPATEPMSSEPMQMAAAFVPERVERTRVQEPLQRKSAPKVARVAVASPASAKRNSIERAYGSAAKVEPAKATSGNHVVQLGSFSSMEGARRAWAIFQRRDPALLNRTMRITQAEVNGRRYFRVVAVGFDRASARGMCAAVQQRGAGCLAYSNSPRPRMAPGMAGSMMARGR